MKEKLRRITKIKVKKGVWYFAWEIYQEETKNWDQHTLSCKDQPRPELCEQIQAMVGHVIDICELSQTDTKNFIISGISLSYSDKGNRYLVITAQKKLAYSKAPLIINTPARPEQSEDENDEPEFCWRYELVDDIELLEMEAWRYVNGDRAQQKLNFDGEEIHETALAGVQARVNEKNEVLDYFDDREAGGRMEA